MDKGNRIFLLLVAFFAITLSSCKRDEFNCIKPKGERLTRTIELEDFSNIYLSLAAEVEVSQGSEFSLQATSSENILNELDIWVNADDLMIESDRCFNLDEEIEIKITMPSLGFVEISSSGNVSTGPNFENVSFGFNLTGSGNLSHYTTTEVLTGQLSGSGNAYIGGSATTQEVELSGSGNFFAYDQVTEVSKLSLSGSGNAEVRVNDSLEARITGSGSVFYKSNPVVIRTGSGSGSVVDAN